MKNYCMSCSYFRKIKERVGYCTAIAVAIEKNVVILDVIDTLKTIKISDEEKIYENIIVQSFFGCILFEDKNNSNGKLRL